VPDDLSSIEGLADKHLRALGRLHVVDLRGLADADPQAIYRTMANLRPRPTAEQIAGWQDQARDRLGDTVPDPAEWHTMTSFVVVFSQRQVDAGWERRVEAEQTEIEPERNPQVWSGWDCGPVCDWMHGQLRQAVGAEEPPGAEPAGEPVAAPAGEPVPAPAGEPVPAPAGEPVPAPAGEAVPASAQPSRRDRAQLSIDSVALVDATGRTEVVMAGVLAANPRTSLVAPVRVVFTIGGASPGARLQAVARILRPDGPGWNPQDPVVLAGPGQAEFDLAQIPAGDHDLALIAWAPDATARPVSVRLPRVTIRPAPG
jgi:hypothetical protein